MHPFPFCRSHVPHAAECQPQSGCSARIRLVRRLRRPSFMPFVSHIGPQAVDLPLTDSIVFQQRVFYLCRLPGRRTQPVENRVFLDPLGTRDTANPHPFRQQRQGFQDRFARSLTSIEHRAARFRKGLTARLAPVALRTIPGFPEADNLCRFDFAVQLTRFVWAKPPHLSQLVRHVSPEHHSIAGPILPTTPFRETTQVSEDGKLGSPQKISCSLWAG